MRAVVLEQYGGPEVLSVEEVPVPEIGPDDVLVRVAYSAINRADILQREGRYADPVQRTHEIPGLEYSGTIVAAGARVNEWNIGDRVMGIESGGCYAEYVATPARQAMPVPASIDLASAAAIPEVFLTAWDALVVQGGLSVGRLALVHAGGSGVGTAAIQIARALRARIAVTASAGKLDACRALGADYAIERSPNDWLAELKAAGAGGVDTVLDVVGGDEVDRNLAAVRAGGTIVQVGVMGGASTSVNVGLLLVKKVHWVGTTLRSRPVEEKIALCQRFIAEMLPLLATEVMVPVVDSTFPLDRVAEAHERMEANLNVGKIVLKVGADVD